MAGIMAALETDDDVGLLREPVDNLPLAFVPPLGADDHHIRHGAPLDLTPVKSGVAPHRFEPCLSFPLPAQGGRQRGRRILRVLPENAATTRSEPPMRSACLLAYRMMVLEASCKSHTGAARRTTTC